MVKNFGFDDGGGCCKGVIVTCALPSHSLWWSGEVKGMSVVVLGMKVDFNGFRV